MSVKWELREKTILTDHPAFLAKSLTMTLPEASGHSPQRSSKLSIQRSITLLVVAFAAALLLSACDNERIPITNALPGTAPLPLFHTLEHESATVSIGIWMFRDGNIANWLGNKYEQVFHPDCSRVATKGGTTSLYEPINVVWLDFASDTEEEAKVAIVRFLEGQTVPFIKEPSELGTPPVPIHTTGYYAHIGESVPIEQYPADITWTDVGWPRTNNHARIFSAFMGTANGAPFFVSSASFSREGNVVPDLHSHISFDCARDALEKIDGWTELDLMDFGNSYPIGSEGTGPDETRFHTGDHSGVRVFVLEADCTDGDSDGYYAESGCGSEVDCNDNDVSINPGAGEVCEDGVDQDCDGRDASCGGSDPGDDCEVVTSGAVPFRVQNLLDVDVLVYFPDFAFGAVMAPGACEIYGIREGCWDVEIGRDPDGPISEGQVCEGDPYPGGFVNFSLWAWGDEPGLSGDANTLVLYLRAKEVCDTLNGQFPSDSVRYLCLE